MKKVVGMVFVAGLCLPVYADTAQDKQPETKQVCTDVKDSQGKEVKNKDGSTKQNCRTVRVHKKHEGTAVPKN